MKKEISLVSSFNGQMVFYVKIIKKPLQAAVGQPPGSRWVADKFHEKYEQSVIIIKAMRMLIQFQRP